MIQWRWKIAVVVACMAISGTAMTFTALSTSAVSHAACERDQSLTRQLRIIIRRSQTNSKRFYAEGLYNSAQYERTVTLNRLALRDLPVPPC